MVSLQHSGHMNLKGGTPLSDASRLPLQPPELAALGTSSSAHPSGSALLAESARFKACFTAELMPDIGRLQYWGPTSTRRWLFGVLGTCGFSDVSEHAFAVTHHSLDSGLHILVTRR